MTQQSENLTVIQTKEGNLPSVFPRPLLEEYEYAEEPLHRIPQRDRDRDLQRLDPDCRSEAVGQLRVFMKRQQLWEAKGNVRGNADGNQLETEQLFWNQKSKRVYSNVDSKITQKGMSSMPTGSNRTSGSTIS